MHKISNKVVLRDVLSLKVLPTNPLTNSLEHFRDVNIQVEKCTHRFFMGKRPCRFINCRRSSTVLSFLLFLLAKLYPIFSEKSQHTYSPTCTHFGY